MVLTALLIGLTTAFAVPAYRGWRTMTQPDGTTITIRQMGDEFFHYWENEDGQQVELTTDGWWRVKEAPSVQSEISKKKQASRAYNKAPGTPRKSAGVINLAPRGLVILVNFSDVSYKSTNTQSAMSDLMNAENYTYNSATGSVREFFKAQSNGAYVPDFDVAGPYTLSHNRAYYGGNDDSGNDKLPGDMVVEACKLADADGVDFTKYNNDGNSEVDFVYIIYAGVGEADANPSVDNAIWPHNWTLEGARSYSNCTYSKANSKVDGLYINNYACSGELEGSATYRCPIGTIAHEFGHVLGLPDYYVTSETAANNEKNYTPGAWHIMDYGSYNNSGRTPPNYSPHDKYYFGWSTPTLLAKDAQKNCTLTTTYGSAYQITGGTSLLSATSTSRVWYLEDRQKSGWDKYLPGHGMVVWEVQYNSSNWTNNTPNNSSVGYTVVTANSLTRPYTPCVYSTTANSTSGTTFPGTSKVTSYTPATGCALTSITESNGNITFLYNGGIDCHNVVVEATGCTITPSTDCIENSTKLTATIAPTDATYDFTSLTVKRGSTTLTSGTHYTLSSDKKSLTINASAITGSSSDAITITAVWTKNRYSYAMLGENCTEELEGAVNKNAGLNLTIAPDAGYTLADAACWDVTMGGNKLTYGTGFTYSGTTFSITTVTGDLEIMAYGLHPVTWSADGSVHATNVAVDGKITLPANPSDCASGKKFVGWCTSSNYSNATTAPTFAKDEDEYSVATYYAVYATPAGSGAPRRAKQASATYNKVTSGTITDGQYLIVYESGNVAFDGSRSTLDAASNTIAITISSSAITGDYEANEFSIDASKGTIKSTSGYYIGQTANNNGMNTSTSTAYTNTLSISDGNFSVLSSGGAYLRYNSNSDQARFRYFKSSSYTSQKAIQLYKKASSGGGGDSGDDGDYTDYSTSCGTPCSQTPVMSFASATVAKTTSDASFTQAVTITGKGSGQTVAYNSSDESIATVNASGAVTLKGVVGSTTITASVAADGDYCAASASYTLDVTAAPISVTLYYNNSTATLNNQTPPYTLPTGSPYNAAMCNGDWTFAGWYGSAYTKSTTDPEYITQLTATGSAYAVYTMTETVSSAPARAKAAESGAVTITPSTTNLPTSYGTAKTFTEYTFEGYKFKVQQMYLTGDKLQWRAAGNTNGTGTMYNTQIFPGKITSIVLTYNSSDANKNFTVKVGSSENPTSGTSITPTTNDLVYTFDCSSANADYFVLANGSGAGYLDQIVINYGSSGGGTTTTTYYATTPECVTPCSNTPTMSFTDATVNKTTADASFTQAVSISGKGDGQTVTYSSSDATVATVDNSGVVTLKGKVGSTTITASVEADGDYCAASASYTLNVTTAPIDVTLYYSGTSETLNDQTNPYTLPATGKYVANMCDDAWTFAGWYSSEYAKSTQKPTYITELTTDGLAAYAVYKTTETSGSGGSATNLIEYDGSTGRATLEAIEGVTTNSVADYAAANSPYLLKFDGTGDYIQFELSVVPTSLSFEYKMIGGGSTSTMTIMECATATGDYTDVEALSISGAQNSTGSLTTSNSFSKKYIRMVFTKGSNVGVGSITIVGGGSSSTTYYATTPDCAITCNLTSISLNTSSAKKTFYVGESFTHDGVVVTANYNNCDSKTVNGFYTVPDMSSAGTKTVNISYTENGVTQYASYEISVVCELTSITLNTASATTTFDVGDTFTSEGVVVTAHYNSCDNKTVNGFYTVPDMSSVGTKTVNVSYTENGVTKETSYDITVVQPVYYTVTWIACGDTIQTETYREGAHLAFPTSPGANASKAFYGWTTTQHYTGTSAPPIISEGGEVHANATYYAVYK